MPRLLGIEGISSLLPMTRPSKYCQSMNRKGIEPSDRARDVPTRHHGDSLSLTSPLSYYSIIQYFALLSTPFATISTK